LLVGLFGLGAPALGQERDQHPLRDLQAAPEPRRDLLILRTGGYEEGVLAGCSDQSCSLGGKSLRRDDIVLIGLGVADTDAPPVIEDALQDSIHLRSAAVLKARLLGINTYMVVSGQGATARRDVTWIYLAPPQPAPPDHAGRPIDPAAPDRAGTPGTDREPSPPPPRASETPQPAPPSGPGSRPSATAPAAGEPHSYVWEGRIEVDNDFEGRTLAMDVHGRHTWRGVYQVKFLEKWIRDAGSVSDASGRSFRLNEIVPLELTYTIQADHHHDYDHRWGDVVLRGSAAGTLTGDKLRDAFIGSMLRFEAAASASGPARPPVPRSFASWREFQNFIDRFYSDRRQGCYELSIGFGGKGQPPGELRALYHGIDRSGSSPVYPDPDQDFLRVMPSHMPDGTNVYGCLEGPGQREVTGEHSYPSGDPGPLDNASRISIRWSFTRCREGEACPRPRMSGPAPQSPPDRCPAPGNEAALLNVALDQQKLLMDRFAARFDEYLRLADEARQYQSDFELAIYTCNRVGDLRTLLGLLMGQAPANVQKFAKYLGVIRNILDGNATFVIEDYVGQRLKVKAIWDTVMFALDRVGPASSPSPREQLMRCAASNLDVVFEDALNFVQRMERIEPLLGPMNTLLNDQRKKDEEIFDLWNKYRAACLEHARCEGLPASMCDGLPSR
jgi:hypothetical protein